jgi:hypothetical protein
MKMLHKSGIRKNFLTQNVLFFNLVMEQGSLLKAPTKSSELTEAPKFRLHLRNAEKEILVECTGHTNIHFQVPTYYAAPVELLSTGMCLRAHRAQTYPNSGNRISY